MKFELKGVFSQKGNEKQFCKTIEAGNEGRAKEKLLSLFGSEHRLKRRAVKVTEINKLKE
jgi:large subunit ribosomal protein LX